MWIGNMIEEAFWTFVDQKWRDALNVAAAKPADRMEHWEQWDQSPGGGQEGFSRSQEAVDGRDPRGHRGGKTPLCGRGGQEVHVC
jgi:hypothetical protein